MTPRKRVHVQVDPLGCLAWFIILALGIVVIAAAVRWAWP